MTETEINGVRCANEVRRLVRVVVGVVGLLMPGVAGHVEAQTVPAAAVGAAQMQSARDLKRLSLEELFSLEVTTVSKRPERWSDAASAIQVLTGDQIRRYGATSVAEALRLASNLQVGRVNASQWAISARGFTNLLANKLLVLIDGRTVYTPLHAGVFWDVQQVLLDDIDRIEVISGPGGTLWGANAVNGVINVLSKPARETHGLLLTGGAGGSLGGLAGVRYGDALNPRLNYRVYARYLGEHETELLNGADAGDGLRIRQTGFRADWEPLASDMLTVQGDYYTGASEAGGTGGADVHGGNLLTRWSRSQSPDSGFQLQVYYDNTQRNILNSFQEGLDTWDIEWQQRAPIGSAHQLVWGAGFRWMKHDVINPPGIGFLPPEKTLRRYSAFVQDQFALVPDRLDLTLGAKLEHNDYTGLEVQPNVRLAWKPEETQTVWAAISRAVRTPVRLDRDFFVPDTPPFTVLAGGPDFRSEELLAFEAGWRGQLHDAVSVSVAAFHNEYDYLRSAEPSNPFPIILPLVFANGVKGDTHGVELSTIVQITERWRLQAGYTHVRKDLELRPGSMDLNQASAESNDAEHQVLVQSSLDLPGNVELDIYLRHVSSLPDPPIRRYTGLDVHLGWWPTEQLELSIIGRDLLDPVHSEFFADAPATPRQIRRSIHGRITWRF